MSSWQFFKGFYTGNKNKGNGNGAGLAWESQPYCFADGFLITDAHSFGTDTQTDKPNLYIDDYMELFKTVPAYSLLFIYFRKYWDLRKTVKTQLNNCQDDISKIFSINLIFRV